MTKEIEVIKLAKQQELARLKAIAEGSAIDNGSQGCPYCELFLNDDCKGCPIEASTGFSFCRLSPYSQWAQHQSNIHFRTEPPYSIECDECRHLIIKVALFVKRVPIVNEDQLNLI